MRIIFLGLIFVSSNAFAFLQQTCKSKPLPDFEDFAGVEIEFNFSQASTQNQTLEIKVYRDGINSESEGEIFNHLEIIENYSGPGSITIFSPDQRIRIFARGSVHPVTGELQLPTDSWIRWAHPLTTGLESVVGVSCLLN